MSNVIEQEQRLAPYALEQDDGEHVISAKEQNMKLYMMDIHIHNAYVYHAMEAGKVYVKNVEVMAYVHVACVMETNTPKSALIVKERVMSQSVIITR